MSARIRILYTTSEDYFGSIARDVATEIRHLDDLRFETAVACPVGAAIERFAKAGAATFSVEMPTKYDPRPIFKLSRIIKEYQPHIVHAHTRRAALFSALAAWKTRVAVIQTEHNWTDELFRVPIDETPRAITALGHRFLMDSHISRVIVYAQSGADLYLKRQKASPDKVKLIYCCVEPPQAIDPAAVGEKRKQLGIEPEALVVAAFGRHDVVKGLNYLIEAIPRVVAACPRTIFCLFGDGKERSNIEQQAANLRVTNSTLFPGWRQDVYDMMALTDVVVSPSVSEVASRILMEAMASGRPTVATNVGGSPEYLGNDSVGLIVPPMDPHALADALISLLADDERRAAMGNAARARYDKMFRPERFISDLQDVYIQTLRESGLDLSVDRTR